MISAYYKTKFMILIKLECINIAPNKKDIVIFLIRLFATVNSIRTLKDNDSG